MITTKCEGVPHIIIPTIRSEAFFKEFLDAWKDEFKGCHIIVVEDRKKKILTSILRNYDLNFTIYDWRDIDKDLGKNAWIIPRETDCVRSYGFYKAWQNKPLFIVTLDDDIKPQERHIETFYKKLFLDTYPPNNFYNTMKENHIPRGTYIGGNGCDVAHGCWLNVPDFSAVEQIYNSYTTIREDFNEGLIPIGSKFSLCGMNIAWKPEITKLMYFGLQGKNYPVDRWGDIWAGNYLTHHNVSVHNGEPFCYHTRASNVWVNLKKEDSKPDESYWEKLRKARKIWESLFR